jgi:large subunit ribosomal protein L19
MNMRVIEKFEAKFEKADLPDFSPGDTIKVYVRVVEGEKVRQQMFQGVVISRRGSGTRSTFTVRKVTDGIGVERIFPLHSPNISKIDVARRGRVRRAKLYYLRERTGKAARIAEAKDKAPKTKKK